MFFVFFYKQKTAYEMRISDWSSDVCSSDLGPTAWHCDQRGREQAFLPLPPRWRHCRRLPEPVLRSTAVPAWQAHRCQHGRHVFRTFISPEKASGSTRVKPRSVSPHVKGILAPYRRNVRQGQDAEIGRAHV